MEPLVESPTQSPALNYATPAIGSRGPRVWACLFVVLGALGLVFLGGCFMIGILTLNETHAGFGGGPPAVMPLTASQIFLECVLYVIAFACFGGAIYFFSLAIAWLRRVIFS